MFYIMLHCINNAHESLYVFLPLLAPGDHELHKDELPFVVDYFGFLLNEESAKFHTIGEIQANVSSNVVA